MMVDGPLAQLVERGAYNAEVRSSSLLWTIFKLENPTALLAQLVERTTVNREVTGSTPVQSGRSISSVGRARCL